MRIFPAALVFGVFLFTGVIRTGSHAGLTFSAADDLKAPRRAGHGFTSISRRKAPSWGSRCNRRRGLPLLMPKASSTPQGPSENARRIEDAYKCAPHGMELLPSLSTSSSSASCHVTLGTDGFGIRCTAASISSFGLCIISLRRLAVICSASSRTRGDEKK